MLSQGKLIEYLDSGRFICAFVTSVQPKRVHLINQNSREVSLPAARIIHCSKTTHSTDSGRDILVRTLRETTERRAELMAQISLEDIWELAVDDSAKSYDPAFLAELSFGQEADDDTIAAFMRCIFIDKLFFKYKEGKIKVHTREQVEQLRIQREKEAQKAELIHKGAQTVAQIMSQNNGLVEPTRWQEECLKLLRNYYLFGNEAENSDIARKMLKEANYSRPHDPFHILVKSGTWSPNENIPLLRSDLPISFSLAARQQAEAILQSDQQELFDDPGRTDLTHLSPITIDGATTLDFDDALTIEKTDEGYLA